MTAATPLRIGSNNGGDAKELFLEVWGGEVLTAYETACKTEDKHMKRNITEGKSAQFPATWKVGASYHTPGAEIVGQTSNVGERTISIDDILLSDVFIPVIDEAMNHFDYRIVYSTEMGRALAKKQDQAVQQVMALAARASATVSGGVGGSTFSSLTTLMRTSAADLVAGIQDAVQNFDEKDIPEEDEKFTFILPAQYYLLTELKDLVNRDWVVEGSNGDYSKAEVYRIKGTTLVKTNNLPVTNITTGPTAYQGNFTKTAAIVCTKGAVGTVQLMDLSTESQYDLRRKGTLMVSSYLKGHGILRPECAVELLVA